MPELVTRSPNAASGSLNAFYGKARLTKRIASRARVAPIRLIFLLLKCWLLAVAPHSSPMTAPWVPPACQMLRNAKLRHAKLRNAKLTNAKLRNAKLRNAKLRNAKLRNAKLRNEKLRNANAEKCKT